MGKFSIFFLLLAAVSLLLGTAAFGSERGSIKGKVESDSGKAVNGAHVTAEREGAEAVRSTTNSKGEFTLADLEPGEYKISVEADGFKSVELIHKQKVEAGKTTKLESKITLGTFSSSALIRGAVFNDRGFSVPGASVEIERVNPKDSKLRKQYTTNEAGEFAFRLPDAGGQFRLTATARGYETSTQTVELQPGESRSVAFSLKATTK